MVLMHHPWTVIRNQNTWPVCVCGDECLRGKVMCVCEEAERERLYGLGAKIELCVWDECPFLDICRFSFLLLFFLTPMRVLVSCRMMCISFYLFCPNSSGHTGYVMSEINRQSKFEYDYTVCVWRIIWHQLLTILTWCHFTHPSPSLPLVFFSCLGACFVLSFVPLVNRCEVLSSVISWIYLLYYTVFGCCVSSHGQF